MACCNWHLASTLTQCGLIHINYICQDPIQIKPHSGVPREPSGVWGRAIQHTSIHASPSPNSKHLTSPTPNPRVIQMQAETLYVRLSSHCSKNRLFLSRVSVSARHAPPVLAEDLGPFRTDPRTCSPDALGKRFPLCSPPRHGQLWALSFTSSGSQTPVLRRPRARRAPSWDRGMLNWQQTGCDGSQLDPRRSAAQPGLATSSSLHTAQNPVFKAQVHPCVLLTPQWSLCTDIAFPPTADSWQIF